MPENQNIEWKAKWKDDYLEWICGFANAQGGKIYIGCDDDGKVIGLPNIRKLLEDVPNKIRNAMSIVVDVNQLERDGKEYLEIVVPPYPVAINCKGVYYYRSGSTMQTLSGPELESFILRKRGASWDNMPLPGFTLDDIDDELVKRFKTLAAKKGRIDQSVLDEDKADLMEKLRLTNAGYSIVLSPLVQDEQGIWRMDFEDMEKKIVANHIHTALFCSPHNPTGRVWERWELEKAMEIFQRHGVYVISDEIWSDIIRPGQKHIPTQMVNSYAKEHTVALYAPSKTFNLAGLIGSYHIIYSKWLRDRVDKESSLCHYNEINVLSMHALIGAYKPEGYEWVDELNQVLANNVDFACEHIWEQYKGIQVTKPQGTYMLFLDCTKWCEAHGKTIEELQKAGSDVGVAWQDGRRFHGPCHIRMNLALPLSRVQEAFARLDKYVFNA